MSLMVASQREHCFLSSKTAVHPNSDTASPNVDPLPWSKRWQRSDSCEMFGRRVEESSSDKSFQEDDGLELSLSLGRRCPKPIVNRTSEEGTADQTVKKAQTSMQQQGMCRNEQQKPQNNEVANDLQQHKLTAVEIWHSIQKTSSQEEIEATSYEAAAGLIPQLVRRSASLQFAQPQRTGGDAVNLQRGTSFQFVDRQPSLIRGLSCTESMEEKDCRLGHDRQQQEAQELQRKRELQAQRRQEARKRRKSLIEEKQLKRAKRDEGKYATPLLRTSSNSAAMQNNRRSPTGNGGGLPLDMIPAKRASVRSKELEQENCVKPERDHAGGKTAAEDIQISLDPSSKKLQPSQLWRLTPDLESSQKTEAKLPVDVGETNGTSTAETETESACQVISTCTEDCQSKTKEDDSQEARLGSEKREEGHEGFIHTLERDESIQGPSSQVPVAAVNTAFPYTSSSFPLFPVPYPLSVPVSTPTGLPLQMGFSVPYFMHLLPPNSQGFTDSRDPACSQPLPLKFPICSAVTSYGMPIPEACLPWLSGALSQAASHHVPQASWGKSSHSMDEHDQASSNETDVRDEMQSLSSNSVQGTSLPSGKHEDGCFLAEPEKPSDYSPDGSLKRAPAEFGYPQRICESEAQFGPVRTVSDSAAQLLLHKEGRRDPYVRGSPEYLKRPLPLRRSFSATRAQTQDAMVAPSLYRDQDCPTVASGSPSQCNVGGLKSEADGISGHTIRKVASGDNLGKKACNLPRHSPIKSNSAERPAVSDLPWVSSTGPAPNGRTVTGVMYIFDKKHVKIVCSCHSTHMSPSEFVQHAGFTDLSNPERNILVNSSSSAR